MDHILLLLYLLSGFTGLTSMVFLFVKYGNKAPYMQEYLKIHFAYTVLILSALVIFYLKINVFHSPLIMSIFLSAVLIWQGVFSWLLPRFTAVMGTSVFSGKTRLVWTIFLFFFPVLAVLQFLLRNTNVAFLPLIIGVSLFFLMIVWFITRSIFSEQELKKNNPVWIYFLIFTVVVIAVEMWFKFYIGFLSDYPINIPLIFLCWNILSIYQFKVEMVNSLPNVTITPEKAKKWNLTEREVEIVIAIAKGDSNKEIASGFNLSFSTVKNHVYNIYKKTGAKSRVDILNLLK